MVIRYFFPIMLSLALLSVSVNAEESPSIKGIYTELPEFKFVLNGGKIEVMEFFSFYCSHCYEFEKAIPVIRGNFPNKLKWKYMPIHWGKASPKPGEAYLLAQEAGKGEEMKRALFEALFIDKIDIGDINVLESIGANLGLGFDFSLRLRAGEKEKEINEGLITARSYSVDSTPTLIIAGNLKVLPSQSIEASRDNVIIILKSILNKQGLGYPAPKKKNSL